MKNLILEDLLLLQSNIAKIGKRVISEIHVTEFVKEENTGYFVESSGILFMNKKAFETLIEYLPMQTEPPISIFGIPVRGYKIDL